MGDWVELVERSYDLAADDGSWGRRIAEAAAPLFGAAYPVIFFEARATTSGLEIEHVEAAGAPPDAVEVAREMQDAAPARAHALVWRSGGAVGSVSERVFASVPEARDAFRRSVDGRIRDAINVSGHVDAERLVLLSSLRDEEVRTSPAERRCWHRAIAHVAAGCRLRWSTGRLGLTEADVEGVFDPDGRAHDLSGAARHETARDALRTAVAAIHRARSGAGRSDPDDALARWQALVCGRWSLVDRFDSDGKRLVVAVPNEPTTLDPRGLTRREAQVAELVGTGRSTKEIAYDLGLSLSTITMAATRAARKLGLSSRAELAAFFAPGGLRTTLEEASIGDQTVLVGTQVDLEQRLRARLSPAEREVAALILRGHSNAAIASRRGTSENTVANQVASIFRKLEVQSRTELGAVVCADPTAAEH